jgi:predicted amidohydrolase
MRLGRATLSRDFVVSLQPGQRKEEIMVELQGFIRRCVAFIGAPILVACAAQAPTAVVPTGPGQMLSVTAVPSLVMATLTPVAAPTELPKRVGLVVASVSMRPVPDKLANLERFEQFMSEAADKGAHLVVFPEDALQQNPGWGTQSDKPTLKEIEYVANSAEPIPGESTARLAARARQLGMYVAFGMTERAPDGKLYNANVLVGPEGVIGSYRKSVLWDQTTGGNEHFFWSRGDTAGKVIDTPIGKIGLMTCIEMTFKFGEGLAREGAQLIVTVSAWPYSGGTYYNMYSARNAIACGCWQVVADQVGDVGYGSMYGHSVVINPMGEVVASTGKDEGMVIVATGYLVDSAALPQKGGVR